MVQIKYAKSSRDYLGVLPFCGFNARQFRTQEMLRPQFKLFGPNQLVTVFRVDLDKSEVSFEIKVDVKIIIISLV